VLLGSVVRISELGRGGHNMANHLSFDVLSRLVERRASAVEEAKAQRHLASCGRCRSELEWLERIRSPLDRATDVEPRTRAQRSDPSIAAHWLDQAAGSGMR
jgi:hypothetical protein